MPFPCLSRSARDVVRPKVMGVSWCQKTRSARGKRAAAFNECHVHVGFDLPFSMQFDKHTVIITLIKLLSHMFYLIACAIGYRTNSKQYTITLRHNTDLSAAVTRIASPQPNVSDLPD